MLGVKKKMILPTDPYQLTECIWQGGHPSPERLDTLKRHKINTIFNLSGASTPQYDVSKFRKVFCFPIEDGKRLPDEYVLKVLDCIHSCLIDHNEIIFVHCAAGWNRSPTIVWLYFLACGMTMDDAGKIICERTLDAVPGNRLLIDDRLIQLVINHGSKRYLPITRPEILTPITIGS